MERVKMATTKPNIQIDDLVREMNDEELAEREILQAETQARIAEQVAKAAARESALSKLADLGLTAEEVAAL